MERHMHSKWTIRNGRYYYEDVVVGISHGNIDDNLNGLDYTRYCVFIDHVTLKKASINNRKDWSRPLKHKLALTAKKFCHLLSRYNEQGFNDMPKWIKDQFLIRVTYLKPRQATEIEQWETVSDALEHRIVHKELTISDYYNTIVKGKSHTIT